MHSLQSLKTEKLRRLLAEDPCLYAEKILGVSWWSKQQEIAQAFLEHSKVSVQAAHSVGKSHLFGGLVNWHYDCFDPSVTLTTAPTQAQVVDVLWKEVRKQRRNRPGLMPMAPRMQSSPDHFASGYTAKDADSFQGRHEKNVFLLFDEAVGVTKPFFEAAEGMMTSEGCRWGTIFNPTDASSEMCQQLQAGGWHEIRVSALEHPNILAALRDEPVPYPGAIELAWVNGRILEWCEECEFDPLREEIFEWPPGSGVWYCPDARFESRVLGRFPTDPVSSIWSEALWDRCKLQGPMDGSPLKLGVDVARFGDDETVIHAGRGRVSLSHEAGSKWSNTQVAGRITPTTPKLIGEGEDPKEVQVNIDDDGVGGGVLDIGVEDGWNWVGCGAAVEALEPDKYKNARSEFWFNAQEIAKAGRIDVSRLPKAAQDRIKRDLVAPFWKPNAAGQRVVEPKDDMKKASRLGRSPDHADAFNLFHYSPRKVGTGQGHAPPQRPLTATPPGIPAERGKYTPR